MATDEIRRSIGTLETASAAATAAARHAAAASGAAEGGPDLFGKDFLLTWDKRRESLEVIIRAAAVLKALREADLTTRLFDSGLAVSQFRDNSTRTRFSFASAANLLGLAVQDLDEGSSQVAHGETVRETATMISFMAEAIGIRDDLYIGKGHAYMCEVAGAVERAHRDGVLARRPAVINLQCDIDHPTQTMADLAHLVERVGGFDELRGRRVAMTWAYSPSYGKPLSVPQGVIGLFTRFGMDVRLAYPEGYSLMGDVVDKAGAFAKESGGSFRICPTMEEAFDGADVVYPKSWAPFAVMEERTRIVGTGDRAALAELEKRCLANNARFKSWECTNALMSRTRDALYLHCLPADITGVSCAQGEVAADVFERFRVPLYRQAGWKPYVIAAMILAAKFPDPAARLARLAGDRQPRL
ncbi:MAG: knotted carbamoyltransferase YgeW [Spirochaetes bacterium]|nr:knotted carbamoyltransferase YgeW [Spirochaetota bacterium]